MYDIVIGCDNAALELKQIIIDLLMDKQVKVEDIGCYDLDESTMYPAIAEKLCKSIINSNFQKKGILLCGTGIGMAITANKFKGIRAAVAHDIYSAERSVLSNDCNVICFGARVIGSESAKRILEQWLELEYIDSPSTAKINGIRSIEHTTMK